MLWTCHSDALSHVQVTRFHVRLCWKAELRVEENTEGPVLEAEQMLPPGARCKGASLSSASHLCFSLQQLGLRDCLMLDMKRMLKA